MARFKKSLFIFRRDLRLKDNTGLIAALTQSEQVIPAFIFDPRQTTDQNEYRSLNALQFMIESLQELYDEIQKNGGSLALFQGKPHEVIAQLLKKESVDAVFVNKDYTPFSIKRDEAIEHACLQAGAVFLSFADLLLHEPEEVLTGSNTPFSIFTPFWKKARQLTIRTPETLPKKASFFKDKVSGSVSSKIFKEILPHTNTSIAQHGARSEGLRILKQIGQFDDYLATRDFPAINTTHLSAHHKFGTISIRESWHAMHDTLGKNDQISRQLYWRDFFTHLAYHSPFVFGQPFHAKYSSLTWNTSKKDFERWCSGTTGFPLVDAGMRELNTTGFMHNRVRMVVASFLIKDLHINWLWGEKYFAQQLIDYDPAVNNGNWQWSASTGADAQPYFRIFNPWLQQKKFDAECVYIKKWVPELKKVDPKIIHTWFNRKHQDIQGYPRPMVDHAKEAQIAKMLYKKA